MAIKDNLLSSAGDEFREFFESCFVKALTRELETPDYNSDSHNGLGSYPEVRALILKQKEIYALFFKLYQSYPNLVDQIDTGFKENFLEHLERQIKFLSECGTAMIPLLNSRVTFFPTEKAFRREMPQYKAPSKDPDSFYSL